MGTSTTLTLLALLVGQCCSLPLIIKSGKGRRPSVTWHRIKDDIKQRALQPLKTKTTVTAVNIQAGDGYSTVQPPDNAYSTIKPDMNETDTETKTGTTNIQKNGVAAAGAVLEKVMQHALSGIKDSKDKAALAAVKGLEVDIEMDEGFESKDVLHPGGVHAEATFEREDKTVESAPGTQPAPVYYVNGAGGMIMNGCFGLEYQPGDPCYSGQEAGTACRDLLDGASYIGTGFDGRGEYSSISRRSSVVQRDCAGKSSYDGHQVPDNMNIQGIYDTDMFTMVFGSSEEYNEYLSTESGESKSVLFWSDSVTTAYGRAESHVRDLYLGTVTVDITRYEVFLDTVGPSNLNPAFLKDFMTLPLQYYSPGAPEVLQDFVLRWGTHYIKSSPFGGKLVFRKVGSKQVFQTTEQFAQETRQDYESLFSSYHSLDYQRSGSETQNRTEFESMSLSVSGGEAQIASALSDMYAPGFKAAFYSWLDSITDYPKPIKFTLGRITDLVNFKESDLFPNEDAEEKWGCEAKHANKELTLDPDLNLWYYTTTVDITKPDNSTDTGTKRVYCPHLNRTQLTREIELRRKALETAVTVYLQEGPLSTRSVYVPPGGLSCDSVLEEVTESDAFNWDDLKTDGDKVVVLAFDMKTEITGSGGLSIPSKSVRPLTFHSYRWYTHAPDGLLHLYNGYNNGHSGDLDNEKISLLGLVLDYKSNDGTMQLTGLGYNHSEVWQSTHLQSLIGQSIARAFYYPSDPNNLEQREFPCNVQWSNIRRMNSEQCLHFSGASSETIFVTLAGSPGDVATWYYVKISIHEVAIYKEVNKQTDTQQLVSLSLGDRTLFRDYMVCTHKEDKSPGYMQVLYGVPSNVGGDSIVWLAFYDPLEGSIDVEYFGFGSGDDDVQIEDIELRDFDPATISCANSDSNGRCMEAECPSTCNAILGCSQMDDGTFTCNT